MTLIATQLLLWGGIFSLEQVYRTWRWRKLLTVSLIWLVWSKWIIVGLLWKVIKEVLLKKCVSLSQNVFLVLEKHGDVGDEVVFNVPFLWFSGEYFKFRIRDIYIGSCLLFFFVGTYDFLTIYCHFHVKGTAGQSFIPWKTAAVSKQTSFTVFQLLRNSWVLLMSMDTNAPSLEVFKVNVVV